LKLFRLPMGPVVDWGMNYMKVLQASGVTPNDMKHFSQPPAPPCQ